MKDLIAFGVGFFSAAITALTLLTTVPSVSTVQWLIVVCSAFGGGLAGLGGKYVNKTFDRDSR